MRDVTHEESIYLDIVEKQVATVFRPCRVQWARNIAQELVDYPDRWAGLVERSAACSGCWLVCRQLVAALRDVAPNRLAASPLNDWALDVATGERAMPSHPRGRDPAKHHFRDLAIAAAVANIRDLGHRPATTSNSSGSACHLVGGRLHLSHDTVRGIWKRHRAELARLTSDESAPQTLESR
ncbi:MAG: hypothetical protein OXH66_14305 [Gemmatimonadetes bacterium]|nr:hypothetical protein [Gemmatimonadota bacterium]